MTKQVLIIQPSSSLAMENPGAFTLIGITGNIDGNLEMVSSAKENVCFCFHF